MKLSIKDLRLLQTALWTACHCDTEPDDKEAIKQGEAMEKLRERLIDEVSKRQRNRNHK
jgi:hypothetical protein